MNRLFTTLACTILAASTTAQTITIRDTLEPIGPSICNDGATHRAQAHRNFNTGQDLRLRSSTIDLSDFENAPVDIVATFDPNAAMCPVLDVVSITAASSGIFGNIPVQSPVPGTLSFDFYGFSAPVFPGQPPAAPPAGDTYFVLLSFGLMLPIDFLDWGPIHIDLSGFVQMGVGAPIGPPTLGNPFLSVVVPDDPSLHTLDFFVQAAAVHNDATIEFTNVHRFQVP